MDDLIKPVPPAGPAPDDGLLGHIGGTYPAATSWRERAYEQGGVRGRFDGVRSELFPAEKFGRRQTRVER